MLHTNRRRANSFGEDAELYDRARPSYPPAVIDRLLRDHPATVLDVGCGTGIASRLLSARGLDVLGLEPDPRMAVVARRYGLTVEAGTFEGWDPQGRRFELVTCAQAWHWVEPARGAEKAAQVVRDGGRIGLIWNLARPCASMQARIDPLYRALAPGLEEYSALLGRGEDDRTIPAAKTLAAAGTWGSVEVERFGWERSYRRDDWLDQLRTHSDHRGLPPEQLTELLDAVGAEIDQWGGSFVMPYETALVTAIKV